MDEFLAEPARGSALAQMPGVVIGIVTNNRDPDGMGRIKVRLPSLSDIDETNWARVAVPMAGISTRGLGGYMRHYLRPSPLLLPLELLSEVSRTLALSLRLFGNMLSEHLIVALLVALAGVVVPIPLMALDLLIGLLQAYIFAVLATVYIAAAIRVGEDA